MKLNFFGIFLILLYVITFSFFVYFSFNGFDYYKTPIAERPHHSDFRQLKPGGTEGHGFGIVGSVMMLVMLLYSVRKRIAIFFKWGSIARWLDLHIYLGVWGPLFIILHSSFKVQGLIAISFYSMLAVALSGVLGRYLFLQIPRNIKGQELSLKEAESIAKQLEQNLRTKFDFTDEMITHLNHLTSGHTLEQKGGITLLFALLFDDFKRWISFRKFKNDYRATHRLSSREFKNIMKTAKEKYVLTRKVLVLFRMQKIFHYWHVIHKPFAIVMIFIMIVHVAVTVTFGYSWIF